MYEATVVCGVGKGKVMWSGPEIIVMITLGRTSGSSAWSVATSVHTVDDELEAELGATVSVEANTHVLALVGATQVVQRQSGAVKVLAASTD